ncbi:IclR family transcriptional regulator [Nocardia miyunensis]|uniref:IclR family transcriptional regulator n=1 Tax=Nocardia miyunensis TaxID=282684 RepID=UPI00082E428D|nr:IclR family transcriptional regulator [Nocardia miyunensis]
MTVGEEYDNTDGAAVQKDSAVEKVTRLLDAFMDSRTLHGVSELAGRSGLSRSTTHRILGELVKSGFVGHSENRYYLTPRMFEVGNYTIVSRPRGLRDIALPYMAELFADIRQVIHLAVLDGTDVLHVEKVHGLSRLPCSTAVGTRQPAYATALGKALLAFSDRYTVDKVLALHRTAFTEHTLTDRHRIEHVLQRVSDEGYATSIQESALGQRCIAVPVLGPDGHAVVALSICCPSGRFDLGWVRPLQKVGGQLARELSRKPIGPPRPS